MPSRRAILAATKAVPGAARPTPAPQNAGAPYYGQTSPLARELATNSGYANSYGPFLPRPPGEFTAGAFGPFSPILPVPVDGPPPGSELPDPRREQYQVGWNLPTGQPGSEGLKLASFANLRTIADLYSVARACIQLRKSEIRGLEWDIMPTKDAAKAMRGSPKQMADFGKRRGEAVKFFKRPDPDYFSWGSWIDDVCEQMFVFDALSIFLRSKRGKGMRKGLLGSDLDCIELVDGETIRPLYDLRGATPRPPAPAYQQYLYGVPRSDFTTVMTGRDVDDGGLSGSELAAFGSDQMLYLPMTRRRWTPYGFPPVERALIPIMAGLQKQGYALDFFREGTVPAVYISPGDTAMTPNQIRELQDALNAFAGDPAWHHKILVLPPGSKVQPQRPAELADQFDEVVMNWVCMSFDVQPMELGIAPKVSTTQSPGSANQMAKASQSTQERKATKPTLQFLAGIMDFLLQEVAGQDDMRFTFEGLEEDEDELTKTQVLASQINVGLRSIDEGREELGLNPWGLPETSDPGWSTATGFVPLGQVDPTGKPEAGQQPTAAAPAGQQPAPPAAGGPQTSPAGPGAAGGSRPPSGKPAPRPAGDGRSDGDTGQSPGHEAAEAAQDAAEDVTDAPGAGKPGPDHGDSGGGQPAKPTRPKPTPRGGPRGAAPGDDGKTDGKTKAVHAELEALGRHLRKGRAITTWQARHVPAATLAGIAEDLAKGLTVDQAVDVAATLLLAKATPPPQEPPPTPAAAAGSVWPGWELDTVLAATYTPRIEGAFRAAVSKASSVLRRAGRRRAAAAAQDTVTALRETLRDALGRVLPDAWTEGWALGQRSAVAVLTGGPVDWGAWKPGDVDAARAIAHGQGLRDLLGRHGIDTIKAVADTRMDELAKAISDAVAAGDAPDALARRLPELLDVPSRAGMIAHTEIARAVSAAALAEYKANGRTAKKWNTSPDDDVCPICQANQKQGAVPIDEDFQSGNPTPPAHPWCRCVVLPTRIARPTSADNPENAAEKAAGQPEKPADNAEEHGVHAGQKLSGIVGGADNAADKALRRVVDTNGQESWVDEAALDGPAAGGGGRVPTRHDTTGTETQRDIPGGVPGATAGGEPPRWDGSQPHPRTGAVPDDEDDAAAPPSRGRPPNPVGKGAADLTDPNPVDAEHIVNQLLPNYPASALGWVRDARWVGPVAVPVDRVDLDDVGSWAASHDQARVKHFAKLLKKDPDQVRPVVAVQEPGDDKIKIVDGHHRTLAARKRGQPVRAYVGFVDRDGGPWDETHAFQHHQGDDPANKAVNPTTVVPGGTKRSGMISLDLPDGTITPHPGGPTDHHITIVYLGPDLDDQQYAEACERARAAAATMPGALAGTVAGLDTFTPSTGSKGKTPAFAPANVPGAHQLRAQLADLSASEHTDYHPHVTLAYLDDGDPLPQPVPATPVLFTELAVHRGDQVVTVPLGQPTAASKMSGLDELAAALLSPVTDLHTAALKLDEGPVGDVRARHLIAWYLRGADGRIPWGGPDDFEACVAVAGEHMSPEQAKGFCNLRHHEATGMWPATHARLLHGGKKKAAGSGPDAAGVAVVAGDTGRVLMLQRASNPPACTCGLPIAWDQLDGWQHTDGSISHDDGTSVSDRVGTDHDPAAGFWELPGGCLEDGETPAEAALREWSEETGILLPADPGDLAEGWTSPDGIYQAFVLRVPAEADLPIHDGRDEVVNPDDPDGGQTEALAWWDPDQLPGNPAVRPELLASIAQAVDAIRAAGPAGP